jgi:hypothetical protein
MVKFFQHYPSFIKFPDGYNGSLADQFKREANNPIEKDVLRCPRCNSRDLHLRLKYFYKSETIYELECLSCWWQQNNPFPMIWGTFYGRTDWAIRHASRMFELLDAEK